MEQPLYTTLKVNNEIELCEISDLECKYTRKCAMAYIVTLRGKFCVVELAYYKKTEGEYYMDKGEQ